MTLHEQKHAMRSRIRKHLGTMSDHDRSQASADLCIRLSRDTRDITGLILAFIPMSGEVDLIPYIEGRMPTGVAVPVVDWDRKTMKACRLHGLGDASLSTGRHGLRTPVEIEHVDPDLIDAIIVPAMAFDDNGGRLGRGGGYYDRFLEATTSDMKRIGVAFDQQIVEKVPVEPWDERVDIVITPSRTISICTGES
ncbi:MAG: 5-formyltetrahydrofolate cyclo-ligase [Phycisphaerales bacterium]|nr:5-formyltetrahydrofolate cyclo-ligase [Phycisphaerales bacterium]